LREDRTLRLSPEQWAAATPAERHEIAQWNAHKNLGLDRDNTAEERANLLFPVESYHGGRDDLDKVYLSEKDFSPFGIGLHSGTKKAAHDRLVKTGGFDDAAIFPVRVRNNAPLLDEEGLVLDEERLSTLIRSKYDGPDNLDYESKRNIMADNVWRDYGVAPYVNDVEDVGSTSFISPPNSVRSRFAAFDPEQLDNPNILAAQTGDPMTALAAILAGGENDPLDPNFRELTPEELRQIEAERRFLEMGGI